MISNTNQQALLRQQGMDCLCKCLSTDTWYDNLQKPSVTPSKLLFTIIYIIIFILLGLSVYFYIRNTQNWYNNIGFILFWIQFGMNFLWFVLFFSFKMIAFSMVQIVLLWGVLLTNIVFFIQNQGVSEYFLIPQLVWVGLLIYFKGYIAKNNQDPFFIKKNQEEKENIGTNKLLQ